MKNKIIPLVLILVSMAIGVFFRFYPQWMPYFDILARQEVYDAESSAVAGAVHKKFSSLPASIEFRLVNEAFKDRLKTHKGQIEARIAGRAADLKAYYRDENGHVYLNGIDSYYWYRLLNNLILKGHIGDRVVNGVEYDDLIGNPIDKATAKNIHLMLGLVFYKVASFFDKGIYLSEALFYIPIFLSCVIAFFSFLVAKKLGAGDLGAFFSSIAVNLSPFLMMRSVGEWFDTDIYNCLFPLLAFGAFLYCFSKKGLIRQVVATCLSGLFLSFYASTWKGWWFVFDIMIVAFLFFILNQSIVLKEEGKDPSSIKGYFISFGLFFAFTAFFVILLNGFGVWKDIILEPLRLSKVLTITPSAWPNVYLTVAELGPMAPFQVAQSLGGYFVFFGSMIGLVYIFLAEHGLRDDRYGFGLLCLVLWIVSTFYASLEALRFVLLLVVPVGLAFGITVSKTYEIIEKVTRKYLTHGYGFTVRVFTVCVFSSFLVCNTAELHNRLLATTPQMNKTWHNALTKINKETPKDAIVDSWWDFGHWFKAIAQKRVLFDGMTQNTPYAYWMANVLLADNEQEAVGILRMINSSANKAADALQLQDGFDASRAVEIVKTALGKDKAKSSAYLKEHLSAARAEELLAYLFPDKLPPVYFIVSYDMPIKINTISYIGRWDFKNVDLWFKKKGLTKIEFIKYAMAKYAFTKEEAESKYLEILFLDEKEAKKWFSSPVGYFSGLADAKRDNKLLFFDNGLVVNLDDRHAYVLSPSPATRGVPSSLIYLEGGQLKEITQKDSNLNYSALLIEKDKKYQSVLLDTVLAKSMLARLYYFGGEGLKHFKLFDKTKEKSGGYLYVFEVKWQG
jgi:dolichyl-diphosphooligosaccharide--protein glycosyltransferase